jgi:hypothetical protein
MKLTTRRLVAKACVGIIRCGAVRFESVIHFSTQTHSTFADSLCPEKQTGTKEMKILQLFTRHPILCHRQTLVPSISFGALRQVSSKRCFCTHSEDPELKDFMEYMDSLKNYEKLGVPRGAGTDSEDGFDLGRMRRLMEHLGNPQSKFKVRALSLCFSVGAYALFGCSLNGGRRKIKC